MTDSQDKNGNSWNKWAEYVLRTLEKIEDRVKLLEDKYAKLLMDTKISQIRIATIFSVGTFVLTALVYLLVEYLKSRT